MRWLKGGVVAGLLCCCPAFGASPAQSQADKPGQPRDEQLDEVLIEGMKPTRDAQEVINWLARLVGDFTYEGHVDLHGKGNPDDQRPVQGTAKCIGFGPAPAVQCEMNVRWPETRGPGGEAILAGVSTLDPAMLLFGFEPDRIGIRYMLVDSKGIADGALGLVAGNTLASRAPCVGIANCQRVTRITADPDLKAIGMQIDFEVGFSKAAAFVFVMKRVPGSSAVVVSPQQR